MNTFRVRLFAAFVAMIFAVCSANFAFSAPCYTVMDLGTLGGYSRAYGINDLGYVVGASSPSSAASYEYAFLWKNGSSMKSLGNLAQGLGSCAYDINNQGQITGSSSTNKGYNHAFLWQSSTGMQDLGSLGSSSSASAINELGQVVGASKTTNGYRAFLWQNSTGMQNLGTLGGTYSTAFGINDCSQVVGTSTYTNGTSNAFLWQSSTGMQNLGNASIPYGINNKGQFVGVSESNRAFVYDSGATKDLGTLGGTYSFANSINNKGQIVGYSTTSSGEGHAFVGSVSTPIQDLNDLISPYSGWKLEVAYAINSSGQIVGSGINALGKEHAFLLTPTGNCQDYKVLPKCYPAIERLAKWDGTNWVPVTSGELSNANIHVLVHGWQPGLRTFANNGGKIWNANDPVTGEAINKEGYDKYTQAAQAIKTAAPGDTVLMFNWLDMSATDTFLTPWDSEANTKEASKNLYKALESACNFSGGANGKMQILGMSHGAKVAALATVELYKNDSVVVKHLTFGDSPEWNVGWGSISGMIKASNNLSSVLPNIKIGRDSNSTFVDNYYSLLGTKYVADSDIVNIKLNSPYPASDLNGNHGYPLEWYSNASSITTTLGVAWSPLLGDLYKTLGSSYEQDSSISEFALKESDTWDYLPVQLRSDMHLATLITNGTISDISNGKCLTEASPAYWHTGFSKGLNDTTIEFSYQFLNAGDGDQLGIWIDDELRFIITGELVGNQLLMSDIDISDLSVGDHILSVALHNYGDTNASVNVFDFTMISVPEPSSLLLLCTVAFFIAIALLRKRYARA